MTTHPLNTHPKKFRLTITNAAEDMPRMLSAYGRFNGGECALVLRPIDGKAALVHIEKTGATHWSVDGQSCGDAPMVPSVACTEAEAVAIINSIKKDLPKSAPITLRGQWRGFIHVGHAEGPQVQLIRKIATYGQLEIVSMGKAGWTWRLTRTERWFSRPGVETGETIHLAKAIEAGLAASIGVLGQACSFKDSHRRSAFDAGHAEKYPVKPARQAQDKTETLGTTPKRRTRKKAAPKTSAAPKAETTKATTQQAAKPKSRPAAKPKAAPASKRRSASKAKLQSKAATPQVDAAQDQLLLGLFADAVKTAMESV